MGCHADTRVTGSADQHHTLICQEVMGDSRGTGRQKGQRKAVSLGKSLVLGPGRETQEIKERSCSTGLAWEKQKEERCVKKLGLLRMERKGAEREFLSLSIGRLLHLDRVWYLHLEDLAGQEKMRGITLLIN